MDEIDTPKEQCVAWWQQQNQREAELVQRYLDEEIDDHPILDSGEGLMF